jgi:hypothetical protein
MPDNDDVIVISKNSPMREISIESKPYKLPTNEILVIPFSELTKDFTPEFLRIVKENIEVDYVKNPSGRVLMWIPDMIGYMDAADQEISDEMCEETGNDEASYEFSRSERNVYKALSKLVNGVKNGDEVYINLSE